MSCLYNTIARAELDYEMSLFIAHFPSKQLFIGVICISLTYFLYYHLYSGNILCTLYSMIMTIVLLVLCFAIMQVP